MKATKEKAKTLSPNLFPVVGIGASAGGLDAFTAQWQGLDVEKLANWG